MIILSIQTAFAFALPKSLNHRRIEPILYTQKKSWQQKCRRSTQSQTHAPRDTLSRYFSWIGGDDEICSDKKGWDSQRRWSGLSPSEPKSHLKSIQNTVWRFPNSYQVPQTLFYHVLPSIMRILPLEASTEQCATSPFTSVHFFLSPFLKASHLPKTQRFACFQKDHATFYNLSKWEAGNPPHASPSNPWKMSQNSENIRNGPRNTRLAPQLCFLVW